jgi:fumarylpyruvate hydrolase
VPAADACHVGGAQISLMVNGAVRQRSTIARLIWTVGEIVHWLSRFVDLVPGDLIYTGTPDGVGAVTAGDVLEARVEGLPALTVSIA